eukprot:7388968-Prymnesium_polylepis.1
MGRCCTLRVQSWSQAEGTASTAGVELCGLWNTSPPRRPAPPPPARGAARGTDIAPVDIRVTVTCGVCPAYTSFPT